MKYAIIALTQFKGQSCQFWMNAGIKCSSNKEQAIEQFNSFINENNVRAKLVEAIDGNPIVVESDFSAPLVA